MSVAMNHERANELLPWLANGSLGRAERALVEQHVKSCLTCRKTLREERRLHELMSRSDDDSFVLDEGFGRLLGRIEAAPQASSPAPAARADGPIESGVWTSSLSRWAIAATVTLALGTAVWLARPELPEALSGDYVTATSAPAASALRIDVIFLDGVGADGRQALVGEIGARVVGGPSPAGRYTLELESLDDAEESLATLLARLRQDPRVRFAGRSFIAEPPP